MRRILKPSLLKKNKNKKERAAVNISPNTNLIDNLHCLIHPKRERKKIHYSVLDYRLLSAKKSMFQRELSLQFSI